ncbi:hypothetical protein [Collimonas humicola]|uniref:hypothetical protein n=1 Tax=Collimonas humicola TaxID=2825886 RepID=UPI001B8C89F5|nr:hypothetical protein [Collimonas humicola]
MKGSDIRSSFGRVSQDRPLYVHSKLGKNVQVRTIRDSAFKSKALLCSRCNNALTQPYDRAWERLSAALRGHPSLKPRQLIKLNKVFERPRESMLDVHLYFVKLFGCRIAENSIPIDIKPFADALLQRAAHPQVFIAIGPSSLLLPGKTILEFSEIDTLKLADDRHVYAQWTYRVNNVTVLIMYAEPGQRRQGLSQSWHPSTQGRLLSLARI